MTVAKQICILEYGVSLSCKRGLKRTQTNMGVSEGGGGGENIHANVNAAKRELTYALFSSQNRTFFIVCFLMVLSSTSTGQCKRRVRSKVPGSQEYENVSWSSFHEAQAENRKPSDVVFRVEAKFFEK